MHITDIKYVHNITNNGLYFNIDNINHNTVKSVKCITEKTLQHEKGILKQIIPLFCHIRIKSDNSTLLPNRIAYHFTQYM